MQKPLPEWDEAQFYASAHRPKLLDGCDRPLYSLNIFCSGMIPYWNQTIWSLVAGVLLFVLVRHLLRKLGKHDPLATRVYLRRLAYYAYYSARSKYAALPTRIPRKRVHA